MVYVFRRDGTVLSTPWDGLFFTRVYNDTMSDWQLHAHVLEPDGVTVKETFVIRNVSGTEEGLLEIWEHIRRFMEEGPEEAHAHTKYSLPLWDRREPFWHGFMAFMANMHGSLLMQVVLSPLFLIFNVGRYCASRTSKIPVWPPEVEEACATEPDDPYYKDWRSNPKSFFG